MLDLTPALLWTLTAVLGLCLGSFINVVVARLPVMLQQAWQAEALEALGRAGGSPAPRFDLLMPRSQCPHCAMPLAWRDMLPLLGYCLRRGRCAGCAKRISPQYPLVELAGALLTLATLAAHGPHVASLFIAGACLTLLALAVIDLRTQLLPDTLTLPLLWAGLLYQLLFQPLLLPSAVLGAMFGYLFLWSFYWLFKLATGKEGMGYGDFKLLAALGAWLGWQFLPLVLILSAGAGALVGIALQATQPQRRGAPLPFGPFLAMAGWMALLYGDALMRAYHGMLGIS